MADKLDDLPVLPPLPDAETVVAAPAAGAGTGELNHDIRLLLEGVEQLQAHQSRQTELIQNLQKSVLTSRSISKMSTQTKLCSIRSTLIYIAFSSQSMNWSLPIMS